MPVAPAPRLSWGGAGETASVVVLWVKVCKFPSLTQNFSLFLYDIVAVFLERRRRKNEEYRDENV